MAAAAVPLLLSSIAFAADRRVIEQDLADRSELALAEAGVPGASVQVSGRDATVTVPGGTAEEDRARTALTGVNGIRTVAVRPRPSVPASGPPEPPVETPSGSSAPYSVSLRGQAIVVTAVVADGNERRALLEAAATRAHGRAVIDELRVQAGVRRPSTGAVAALVDALAAGSGNAAVEVAGRSATLTGNVASSAERSRLLAAAKVALPDSMISDQLVVQAPVPVPAGGTELATILRRTPVAFGPNSARVTGSSSTAVATIAVALRSAPGVRIAVVGHSARIGESAAERQMGLSRAEAVADALVRAGISRSRLIVSTAGATRPVSSEPAGVSRNRRVELTVIGGAS
jgi:outer membrane protein OmpA-like peptidoglycan-associated protein